MKNTLIIPLFCIINLIFSPVFANKITKKDHHGFWVNAEEQAFKEAEKSKKPLMIDFYGIWCPPCNQLDELVYSTKEFQKVAKKFVLLKMDADLESSWQLKSKYKVGGYPTLVMIENGGTEIDRIIGYYPTPVITAKMQEALTSDGVPNEAKIMKLIQKSIQNSEDDATTLKYLDAGLALEPDNLNFKLSKLKIQTLDKTKDGQKILSDVLAKKKDMPLEALVKHFEIKPSREVLDELLSRVNPETLYVDKESYTEADIYSLGADWNEKEYLGKTIQSYEKLLKKYGNDSRSLNLSYTYYLQKNKDFKKAQDIYTRMIQKYPEEFTFHYQAAQMGLDMQDYILAKKHINEALKYAYGDNKIRSMDRAVKIAVAAKDKPELKATIEKAESFIKNSKSSEDLKVRTDRYLNKLATTLDEAKKQL